MPIVDGSDFRPSLPYSSGHFNTFAPYLFGKTPNIKYKRDRLLTPDQDFLDIDTLFQNSNKVIYLLHGLEGSSKSSYILRFTDFFFKKGFDVIAMNYRGCSGEINRSLTMYNSGTTGDLDWVIRQTIEPYSQAVIMGFSLGGNLLLKYLGENQFPLSPKIKSCLAISAPVHLSNSSQALLKPSNFLYQLKFLNSLLRKIYKKHKQFPDQIHLRPILKIRNLFDFDNYYTAPLFGYTDAEDYYAQNQSLQFLSDINVPSMIINALDDPFLGKLCYPFEVVENTEFVSLCAPAYGGHVGFASGLNDRTWMENRVWSFIKKHTVEP